MTISNKCKHTYLTPFHRYSRSGSVVQKENDTDQEPNQYPDLKANKQTYGKCGKPR